MNESNEDRGSAADGPWPDLVLDEGDHFVSSRGPYWQFNACVGTQIPRDAGWEYYREGFRLAARNLVANLTQQERDVEFSVDIAVYPILYLYRHYFELVIKCIIAGSGSFLDDEQELPYHHRLHDLWSQAIPLVEKCFPDTDWGQNPQVTRLFKELSDLDPGGQNLRYPEAKDGSISLQRMRVINILYFAETAEKLAGYLEQVLFGIEVTDDQKREWESEAMSHLW